MSNTIKIKRSSVAGKSPTTSQLSLGELAVNTTDGKVYLKKEVSGVSSIVELGKGSGPILQSQQVIDKDFALDSGYNGLSVGPVEIAAGKTVEVPQSSTWIVKEF